MTRAKRTPGTPSPRPASAGAEPAILVGANEDHRRLLRGLLLLHHQPVALEASSLDEVPPAPPDARSRILVYVAPPEGIGWSDDLRGTLAGRPDLKTLVLLPLDEPSTRKSAALAGARAVLSRPFTSREFLEALDRLASPGRAGARARAGFRSSSARKARAN